MTSINSSRFALIGTTRCKGVFARLIAEREFLDALVGFRYRVWPRSPGILRPLAAFYLRRRTRASAPSTSSSLRSAPSTTPLRRQPVALPGPVLMLDPGGRICSSPIIATSRWIPFVNYATHAEGFGTVRIAIGDNLLDKPYVSDLMRLNKSFVVQRSFSGPKDQLAAFKRTSAYLHHSIGEERHSVWIAQREGRAKDGNDRTDPAILKMFFVSQRKSGRSFAEVLADLHIVPVAVSYELDPCAPMKARELHLRETAGSYEKPEDLQSIVRESPGPRARACALRGGVDGTR